MREIVADGIASFKIFLAYKNFFGVDDGEMYQTLELAQEAGRDRHRALRERRAGRPACNSRCWRKARRGPSGTSRAARNRWKRKAPTALRRSWRTPGRRDMSCICPRSAALDARDVPRNRAACGIWVESVLPHFLLDKTYAERPGVEGMKHVMSPPLRDQRNQKIALGRAGNGI